jgi:hypothetical protein
MPQIPHNTKSESAIDTKSKCAIGVGAIRGAMGIYQIVWGCKRRDYRSVMSGCQGLADGALSLASGVKGRSQWIAIGANAGAAIDQAMQIRKNGRIGRGKGGQK